MSVNMSSFFIFSSMFLKKNNFLHGPGMASVEMFEDGKQSLPGCREIFPAGEFEGKEPSCFCICGGGSPPKDELREEREPPFP